MAIRRLVFLLENWGCVAAGKQEARAMGHGHLGQSVGRNILGGSVGPCEAVKLQVQHFLGVSWGSHACWRSKYFDFLFFDEVVESFT